MEGAFILLVLIVIVFGVVGGVFWLSASKLRRKKMALGEDELAEPLPDARPGFEDEASESESGHPVHERVDSAQNTRFVSPR